MKVSHLLPEVISRLRSGIAITSCSHAIEELVLNAIDAGATCVAVRLNLPFFKLQVIDNGVGIPSEFFNLIGERYATSKCHSLEDLRNIKTGGFRGEALSSLVDVSSIVEIVSCSSISNKTFCKIFKQGKSLPSTESKIRRASKGTTVTIFDFMYNLPVRKNCISEILDVEQCRKCLEIISLMHPHISFSLRNDSTGDICLQTRKCYSTLRVFAQLFGQVKANSMKEVSFSHGKYRIEGYINCDGHISKDLQFLYINKRHILKTKLHKLINTILNKAMFTRQKINVKVKDNAPTSNILLNSPSKKQIRYNIFVLDISCPYDEYDIILEPRKTLVEFENWDAVIELVQKTLFNFLQNQNFLCSPISTDFLASSFDVFGSTSIINNHNNHEEQAVIPEKFGKGINAQNVKNGLFSAVVKRLPPVTNEKKNNVSKLNFDSESYTAIEENCGKEPSPLISKKFLNSICQEGTSDSSSIGKSLYIKSYDTELDNNVKGTSDSEYTRYSDLSQTSCELRHSFVKPVTLPFSLENDGDINDCFKRRNAVIEEMQNVKFGAVHGHKVANHNDINSYQMTLSEQHAITTKHLTGSQILKLGSSSFGACCDKMQCTCVHTMAEKIPTVVCKEVCKDQQSVFLTKTPIKLKFPVESSISKFEKLLNRKRAHVENNDMKVVDAFDHKKPFSHIQVPNINPIKLRIPVKTSLTYLEKYSKKSEVLGQLKNAFQYCSQTGHRTLANDVSYKQTDDQMKLTMYNTQSREIKKKKIIGFKEICNVKKSNPFDKYCLSKVNHKNKSHRQISSRFPINQDFAFGANGKGTKQLSTTFCDKVFGLSLNKAKLLSGCNSQNIVTVTDSPENSGNCSEPHFISNCTSKTGFTETCTISKPHSNVNGLGFKDVASKSHDCSEVFISLNEMNGNYCRAKTLLPINDSPKCLEFDAPKACESETMPDNMGCEYEIFLGNREYQQITSSSVECSDCHESNRTKDNLNFFQQHISEESITSNSLIPEAVIDAECSTVNLKTTFPNQCNNLPSTVVNKIFDSKYITTSSLGLKCSEQQKALQENINLCDNSEDFFISLPVKSNDNTSENTKNFQCPTQKHSNISISSCNHMSARDQSKKSSQGTCIASLLDNVINEVSMIHTNDNIKKVFSCKQTSTTTEADITHSSHSVSGHSDSSGSLINDTKLHPSELCYNNFDEQLNVSNVNLSESEREILHNSKITSRPLNNIHPQSSEEIFQKNNECTESKAALVKKARWLCKKDPVTGKCVYFDSITGNSTYNLPLEYKHVQQTIQQNKHCYQSDVSCIAEENCSHFFLSHDSTPFMARPPKLRKNKVYRSEEERNLQSECNSSELQDDLDIHIKDQDTNEISEKWRERKPVFSDNRVEELFNCWENPMFTKSDAEVLTVPSTSSNSQNQPKMYTILNSYRFSRVAFPHLQVLGQVDCKFIACIIQDVNENMKGKKLLVLFDQHAVHERIRLEQLIEDMYEVNPMNEKVVKSTALSPPLVLLLKPEEIRLLKAYQNRIKSLGLKLSFEKDMLEIKVHAVPTCLIKRESSELKRKRQPVTSLVVERILQEWLMSLEQTRGGNSIIPKTLSAVLNSQACRGAIKFGDPLDITQCKQLLKALAECKLPFQCAHGRPSLAPLLDLQKICHLDEKMPKLQLWKLKAKVKGD